MPKIYLHHFLYSCCFCFLLAGLPLALSAQIDTVPGTDPIGDNSEMQLLIENLLQDTEEEDFSFDTQFEYLEAYARNPLDINNCTQAQLVDMGLLSELQIQGLINYRRRYGQIYSFYELLNLPNWDRQTVVKMLPYLRLDAQKAFEKFSFKRAFKYNRNTIFARYARVLEDQKGFIPLQAGETGTRYLGSPDRLYLRYRMTYKDRMSIGATMEKDAGEEFFKGSNKQGFDYYSAHFFLKNPTKRITAIALGDFQIYFGQGLIMWAGFGTRKGAAVLNIKRFNTTIRPYTSANEALFLRGGAVSADLGKRKQWETTLFVSYRRRDGNISALDTLDDEEFGDISELSSLQITGFHRTPSELFDRNSLGIFTTGASVKYKGENWHIASNNTFSSFDVPLQRSGSLYQQYLFAGKSLFNTSLDYSYHYKTAQFFGETALSSNGGLATLNGLLLPLDSKVSFSMLHRYFARNYQHLYGNSFGERIGVNNETGLYMGLEVSPIAGLKLSMYGDMYRFLWLTSLTDFSTGGFEGFFRADYSLSRRWSMYVQLRSETKGRNIAGETGYFDRIEPHTRQSARLHLALNVSPEIDLRTRLEISGFNVTGRRSSGVLFYQDFNYKPKAIPLKIQLRLAIFDTPDFDTRIYAYENDVLYSFSVPAYFGRGMRWYINGSYDITPKLTAWFRIAQTYFNDRDVISSGLNEIQGRSRTDVRFQLRYQF
jgi:hypothetical protein